MARLVYKKGCPESERMIEAVQRSSLSCFIGLCDIDVWAENSAKYFRHTLVRERYPRLPALIVPVHSVPKALRTHKAYDDTDTDVQVHGDVIHQWLSQYDGNFTDHEWFTQRAHEHKDDHDGVPGRSPNDNQYSYLEGSGF